MTIEAEASTRHIGLAIDIVSAFVSHNSLPANELPGLVVTLHATLNGLATRSPAELAEPPTPAVAIKRSIMPDYLVCLEDGKRFKSLKRHLRTRYNLTPDEYRARWGLAPDYPMVAPNYAAARSELAKTMGLGQQRRKTRVKAAAD